MLQLTLQRQQSRGFRGQKLHRAESGTSIWRHVVCQRDRSYGLVPVILVRTHISTQLIQDRAVVPFCLSVRGRFVRRCEELCYAEDLSYGLGKIANGTRNRYPIKGIPEYHSFRCKGRQMHSPPLQL
jgi:hypothetical protein